MKIGIIFLFLILFCQLQSQQILEHLTKSDGLPSNYTSGIVQDNDGYIWIATPKGAARYDGKTMRVFTVDDGLTSNEITGFFKDGFGRIWFNCFGGKPCYYYKGEIYNGKKDRRIDRINFSFFSLKNISDSIFVCSEFLYFRKKTYMRHSIVNSNELKIKYIDTTSCEYYTVNTVDSVENELYYATSRMLNIKMLLRGNIELRDATLFYNEFIGIRSFEDTFYLINFRTNKLEYKAFINEPFISYLYSNKNGLIVYNTNRILRYNKFAQLEYKINSTIRGLAEDNTGNFWISSDNGVYKMKFENTINETLKISIPIYTIKRIGSNIFMGSDKQRMISLNSRFEMNIHSRSKVNIDNRVLDLLSVEDKVFKISDRGLFDNRDNKFALSANMPPFKFDKVSFKNVSSKSSKEFYFSGGTFGVFSTAYKDSKFSAYRMYFRRAFNVFYRNNGDLIGSTVDGLLKWKNDTSLFQKINIPFKNVELINHINEDKAQNLILSSNNGLIINANRSFFLIDKHYGLLDNHINKTSVSEDGKRLYICTNKGLNVLEYRINNKQLFFNIKSYTTSDGLPSEEVNCALEDGDRIYVGTQEGLGILSANDTIFPYKIPILLESLTVNDTQKKINENKFRFNENSLRFNFSAFYFQRNREMQFAYQLLPIDHAPIISDRPEIMYRALAPNSYTLKVFAFDKHYPNIIKSDIWSYSFIIAPPFYNTWWFYMLLTAVLVSFGFAVYIIYNKRKQKRLLEKQELLKQMAVHKLDSLKGQMNPHFIFNSLNTVQHFISGHNEEEAMNFISKFSSLIRKMLEHARQDKIRLDKEILFLKEYCEIEQIRYSQKFDLKFIVDLEDEENDIEIPTMLIQPLLENAIKHGVSNLKDRRGQIDVHICKWSNEILRVSVKDNGYGNINTSTNKNSNSAALEIIRDRLSIYEIKGVKGEFVLKINELGAEAILKIPI